MSGIVLEMLKVEPWEIVVVEKGLLNPKVNVDSVMHTGETREKGL